MLNKNEVQRKAEQLSEIARKGQPMPEGLLSPEQLLFQSMRLLYKQFSVGIIEIETAKSEKREIIRAYTDNMYSYDLYKWQAHHETVFQHLSQDIKDNGCEVCKKLKRTLQGLENIEEEKQ